MNFRVLWVTMFFVCTLLVSQINCDRDDDYDIEHVDMRRPIWNIGHMVNSIPQVDEFLDLGANALESDVTFNSNGNPEYVYHGTACDCFRWCEYYENIDYFIKYVRRLTTPGNEKFRESFILMMWDLKLSYLTERTRRIAGSNFAKKLINLYWKTIDSNARLYMIVSIPSTKYGDFIESFRKELNDSGFKSFESKIGYDFSGNEDLEEIRRTYSNLGIYHNIWQSDGISNCVGRHDGRLVQAITRREFYDESFINKVYSWTYNYQSSIQKALLLGIDGLIMNRPDNLIAVLQLPNYRDIVRLATYEDNPFQRIRFTHPEEQTESLIDEWWEEKMNCNGLFEFRDTKSYYGSKYNEMLCDDKFL